MPETFTADIGLGIAFGIFGIAVIFLWMAIEIGGAPRDPDDDPPEGG